MRRLVREILAQVITLVQHSRRQTPPLMAMRMPQQMRVLALESRRILLVLILASVMLPIRAQLVTTRSRKYCCTGYIAGRKTPRERGFCYILRRMFVPLAVGTFGLIIGSFLNVLILRHGERSLLGRSACPSCKKTIRWRDLIPVFSWILLRGRCRDCGRAISIQYPLVEAGTAVLFFFIALAPISLSATILALPIASLLLAIAVYDFHTTYIPDSSVWTLSALALHSVATES